MAVNNDQWVSGLFITVPPPVTNIADDGKRSKSEVKDT